MRNDFTVAIVSLVFLAVCAPPVLAQEPARLPAFTAAAIEEFATLPVQDGGRVKPMDTFAQFAMLKLNGKRSLKLDDGRKLYPVEWIMACLFAPEAAGGFQHFMVNDSEAIVALKIPTHEKKRDRYSYNELLPGRERLAQLGMEYSRIDPKQRTAIEEQILNLAHNVFQFEQLIHYVDFARLNFTVPAESALSVAFGGDEHVMLSTIMKRLPGVMAGLREQAAELDEAKLQGEVAALDALLDQVNSATFRADGMAIFPPVAGTQEAKEWMTLSDVAKTAMNFQPLPEEHIAMVAALEGMAQSTSAPDASQSALSEFRGEALALAQARGEYSKVPLEYNFYKYKFLFYSQWLFVLSFVLVALSWLVPRSKWLARLTPLAVSVPLVLLTIGITLRCIIRDRPPVTTLYETILFITAIAVLVCVIIEFMNRQRVAIALGSFLGMVGMFIAFRYEAKEGMDTMPSLVAVLDTNFWLSTHVTTVTMGYAAGLLAAALAHVYILGKLFRFRRGDNVFYGNLTRMTYGVICFGLLFSVVGTILGGIWANDSWGRFWGWDPKENGALMICIWGLVILHARLGNFIKDMGVAMSSIFLGMVVTFSWWGVNLLGVGLHSYGFTSGIMGKLMLFWGIEFIVLLLGAVAYMLEKDPMDKTTAAAA